MYVLILNILKYKKFIVEIFIRVELKIIKILLVQFLNNSIRDIRVFNVKVIYNVDNYIYIIKGFLSCESIIIQLFNIIYKSISNYSTIFNALDFEVFVHICFYRRIKY